jgi:3-oxoacyl-[acyl-carrier-protein] synthase-3
VVGAELLSSAFDYTDAGRDMAVLFADGAGAVVLQAEAADPARPRGLITHHLHSDGTVLDGLSGKSAGRPRSHGLEEDRRWAYASADERARRVRSGRAPGARGARGVPGGQRPEVRDVDLYLFHQANLRIVESVAGHFQIPAQRAYNNIGRYGNTAAASVPICLHEAWSDGRLKDGDLVMLLAFGTGFSWGATLLRW